MRFWLLIWTLLLAVTAAQAAPTCLDKTGATMRCNTPGAMPVGWKPPPRTMWERQLSLPPNPSARQWLEIVLGLAGIFALIALLPNFDGDWDPEDEDRQR